MASVISNVMNSLLNRIFNKSDAESSLPSRVVMIMREHRAGTANLLSPLRHNTCTVWLPLDMPFNPDNHTNDKGIKTDDDNCRRRDWRDWRRAPSGGWLVYASREALFVDEGVNNDTEQNAKPPNNQYTRRRSLNDGEIAEVRVQFWQDEYLEQLQFIPCNHADNDGTVTLMDRSPCLEIATVIAICFAVDDLTALESLPHKWAPRLRHCNPIIRIVLIACDIDKRYQEARCAQPNIAQPTSSFRNSDVKCITREQGDQMAREMGAIYYVECSKKTGKGMDIAFQAMAAALLEQCETEDGLIHTKLSQDWWTERRRAWDEETSH